MTERLLVPVDFSPYADWTLDTALVLARGLQARIVLLHVRGDTSLNPLSYTGEAEAEARHRLEGYLQRVQDAGLQGDIILVHGVPWREIVANATAQDTTLIVMGSHGRSGWAHMLLGSVAERVVRSAPCPVLVIPRPQGAAEQPARAQDVDTGQR